ncbi:class C sortase [Jeotgalibacillus haloalkalitolerans]|uniref:Class C sortase n=1 Tax=Jeotgalibacillus haloalkalitolerans TaxID=3104292 RepID=A0ABU5KJL9_9BACL|nr:class C sortase [Jeotgalibacillus sp. HH7-29]MDZ5711362.1 class C sortase [Jeotgalibacillus sp. HH7-29]
MKKIILTLIFIAGLGLFLYPVVSDMLATTAHQAVIKDHKDLIEQTDQELIAKEKEKVNAHNETLASSDLNFVDPFAEISDNESSGTTSYYDALNLGPIIGNVRVPSIDVELPIYHGTTEEVLSKGAGHLENSSLPSSNAGVHSVITAHRGLPSAKMFRDLDELSVGDHFYIEVLDETIAYEVEKVEVVLPSETSWINMDHEENKATLLTCDPYMINTHRMLVTGTQVPYEPGTDEEIPDTSDDSNVMYLIIIGVALLILVLIIIFIRKRKQGDDE